MQEYFGIIKEKAEKLLADGSVNRVIGWKKGESDFDRAPNVFTSVESLADFIYDGFCGANLSKYLILETKKEGKVLVMLKPCDTYSFNQLVTEHAINRDNVYVLAIPCEGKIDINKIRAMGIKGITNIEEKGENIVVSTLYGEKTIKRDDVLIEKCACCKSKKHVAYDELIGEEGEDCETSRFELVEKLEAMTDEERFNFWRSELSKCIRCNACRNVCPACHCTKCVFDNDASGVAAKANSTSFEENMFHIIRAFHVAGRCTDCGECSRVCPQNIPLHLLNRKFIKDINEFYGDYQAGAEAGQRGPLTNYTKEDIEPTVVSDKGGNK